MHANTTRTLKSIPHITPHDIILILRDISPNITIGDDKLSVRLLRLALPYILLPLTDIINRAIDETTFPRQWKDAIVTPIYKGGDKNDPSNYRPISVLPILSKILKRHLLKTLDSHLLNNGIISKNQSGFRKNHSCLTTMHHLYSTWIDAKHNKKSLLLLFLDFKKVFDMIDHETNS